MEKKKKKFDDNWLKKNWKQNETLIRDDSWYLAVSTYLCLRSMSKILLGHEQDLPITGRMREQEAFDDTRIMHGRRANLSV